MASEPREDGDPEKGRRRSWPDLVLALVTLPILAVFYFESLTFRKMDWEPLGMAFWPQVVLIGLAVLASWFFLRGLTHPREIEPFLPLAMVPWGAGIVFIALLPWLGTYIAGFILIAAMTFYLRPGPTLVRLKVALANAAVTLILIHVIFSVALGLRMPTSFLGV